MVTTTQLLAILLLSASVSGASFGIVHAASGLPGVEPGDTATYGIAVVTWHTTNASVFPNPFPTQNGTDIFRIDVTAVLGTNVTAFGYLLAPNGTAFLASISNIDVQTESFCVSNPSAGNQTACYPECPLGSCFGSTPSIIASGLQAPSPIGQDPSVTIDQTVNRTVLNVDRTINVSNLTFTDNSVPPPGGGGCIPGGCPTLREEWNTAWDQSSGIMVEQTLVESWDWGSRGSASGSITTAVASTNIWSGTDFAIASSPSSVTTQGGGPGSSTITLTSLNGFAGTVALQVSTSSSQLSCSLASSDLTLGLTVSTIVSCNGSSGAYTVSITATSGGLSHSTTLAFTILHGHRHQPQPH